VREVIPSVILDIRYFSVHNFVGTRVEGYNAPKCILTRKAAEALSGVQQDLQAFGLSLKMYDCYRPQRAVDHFCRWAQDIADTKMKKEFYPTVEKSNLFIDGYIDKKSGHSRGSTVDVTIVALPLKSQGSFLPDAELSECYLPLSKRFADNGIDMGTGFDCFHELSHTKNGQVGLEQRINRLLLKSLMEKHGFANYDKEWWHFTLKGEPFPDTYFNFAID
jgi:zinc D-Ala-D-Ala dipeptidase